MVATAALLLSCEHASRAVPGAWSALFRGRGALLRSHRGWDPGALEAARWLARRHRAPLVTGRVSRLLVDLNRSAHNPAVFSELSAGLSREERAQLLARHHAPHWAAVRREVARLGRGGATLLHVAVHSFTPVLHGRARAIDVGLLYDPARRGERALCAAWQAELAVAWPGLRVRRNAPYRGSADGLTRALRREHPGSRYLGIELELSQAWLGRRARRERLLFAVSAALARAYPGLEALPAPRRRAG